MSLTNNSAGMAARISFKDLERGYKIRPDEIHSSISPIHRSESRKIILIVFRGLRVGTHVEECLRTGIVSGGPVRGKNWEIQSKDARYLSCMAEYTNSWWP